MRFIGNQPIPEHVNPPEDFILTDQVQDDRKESAETTESTQNPTTRRRRGKPGVSKPAGNREAA
jgi:hypothetical protein